MALLANDWMLFALLLTTGLLAGFRWVCRAQYNKLDWFDRLNSVWEPVFAAVTYTMLLSGGASLLSLVLCIVRFIKTGH